MLYKQSWFWLLCFACSFLMSSCSSIGSIFDEPIVQPIPDTAVLSIQPDFTEVKYYTSDTSFSIIAYWTDADGRRLYCLSEEHFMKNRLHGPRREWSNRGQLLHESFWETGLCLDSEKNWYKNGQLAQQTDYDEKGNKKMQVSFHENGKRLTDSVMYFEGKLDGRIDYYDTTGMRVLESYTYQEDKLIDIDVYRPEYISLARRAESLKKEIERDSIDAIRLAEFFAEPLQGKDVTGDDW